MINKKNTQLFFFHILNILLCFIILYPIIWLVIASFKESKEIFNGGLLILPKEFLFENYTKGWNGINTYSFSIYFKNSLIISSFTVLATVLTSALVAYGFAKNNFALKKFWFACLLLTIMLPTEIIIIPQYVIFKHLGLVGTFFPIILTIGFGNPFFIFLTIQFMKGIPKEIDESALIDGAGKFSIFFRIYLPLIKSILFLIAILSFNTAWTDYLQSLIYLTNNHLWTISVALNNFSAPSTARDWGAVFAMANLSLIPPFVVFFFMQLHINGNISATTIKN
jgi:multiple sugar transport system permease protein